MKEIQNRFPDLLKILLFFAIGINLLSAQNLGAPGACQNCQGQITVNLTMIPYASSSVLITIRDNNSNLDLVYQGTHSVNTGTNQIVITHLNITCNGSYYVMASNVPFGSSGTTSLSINTNTPSPAGSTAGSISAGTQYFCSSPSLITNLQLGSVGTCTKQYQWEKSTNGTTWTPISNAFSASHQPANVTQTTRFRRGLRVSGSSGPFIYTNEVLRTPIESVTDPGSISIGGNDSYITCGTNNDLPDIQSDAIPSTPPGGSLTYLWQKNVDNGGWLNLAGTSISFNSATITSGQSVEYRRGVRSASCHDFVFTPPVTFYSLAPINGGGTIGYDQTACAIFDVNAPDIVSLDAPSSDPLVYSWFRKSGNNYVWQSINGANQASLDVGSLNITETTYFRRNRARTECPDIKHNSNTITYTVIKDISDAGTISNSEYGCGAFTPQTIVGNLPSGGSASSMRYQWYYDIVINNPVASPSRLGPTSANWEFSGNITQSHSYMRRAWVEGCGHEFDSEWIFKIVNTPVSFSLSSSDVQCFEGNDGSISVNIISGPPPFTINWATGQTTSSSLGVKMIPNFPAGNHQITVTDANGCTAGPQSVTISQPTAIVLQITKVDESSPGANDGSVTMQGMGGTGPYTYYWNDNVSPPTVENLSPGAYQAKVVDAQNCESDVKFITIVAGCEDIVVTPNVSNANCFGANDGAIEITVEYGDNTAVNYNTATYSWSGPNGYSSAQRNISGLGAGSYNVSVTDDNGCSGTANSISISQPSVLDLTLTTLNETFPGAGDGEISSSVSGGTPAYSYLWSTGSNAATIQNLIGGSYQLTVTDHFGCTEVDGVTVNCDLPIPEEIIENYQSICEGDAFDFYGDLLSEAGTYEKYYWNDQDQITKEILYLETIPLDETNIIAHTMCESEQFILGEQIFSSPGTYTIEASIDGQCSRKTIVQISYYQTPDVELFEEILPGESFTFQGQVYNQEGTYLIPSTTIHGCSYTTTLHLDYILFDGGFEIIGIDEEIFEVDPTPIHEILCHEGLDVLDEFWVEELSIVPSAYEQQALKDLYYSLKGDQWTINDGWIVECDPCKWYGVDCDGSGNVVSLNLPNNNLSGRLPSTFGNLNHLQTLDLSLNRINGVLPAGITSIYSLQTIYLNDNLLQSPYPEGMRNLCDVQIIDLSNNNFNCVFEDFCAGFCEECNVEDIAFRGWVFAEDDGTGNGELSLLFEGLTSPFLLKYIIEREGHPTEEVFTTVFDARRYDLRNLRCGTYSFHVIDANGCGGQTTVSIGQFIPNSWSFLPGQNIEIQLSKECLGLDDTYCIRWESTDENFIISDPESLDITIIPPVDGSTGGDGTPGDPIPSISISIVDENGNEVLDKGSIQLLPQEDCDDPANNDKDEFVTDCRDPDCDFEGYRDRLLDAGFVCIPLEALSVELLPATASHSRGVVEIENLAGIIDMTYQGEILDGEAAINTILQQMTIGVEADAKAVIAYGTCTDDGKVLTMDEFLGRGTGETNYIWAYFIKSARGDGCLMIKVESQHIVLEEILLDLVVLRNEIDFAEYETLVQQFMDETGDSYFEASQVITFHAKSLGDDLIDGWNYIKEIAKILLYCARNYLEDLYTLVPNCLWQDPICLIDPFSAGLLDGAWQDVIGIGELIIDAAELTSAWISPLGYLREYFNDEVATRRKAIRDKSKELLQFMILFQNNNVFQTIIINELLTHANEYFTQEIFDGTKEGSYKGGIAIFNIGSLFIAAGELAKIGKAAKFEKLGDLMGDLNRILDDVPTNLRQKLRFDIEVKPELKEFFENHPGSTAAWQSIEDLPQVLRRNEIVLETIINWSDDLTLKLKSAVSTYPGLAEELTKSLKLGNLELPAISYFERFHVDDYVKYPMAGLSKRKNGPFNQFPEFKNMIDETEVQGFGKFKDLQLGEETAQTLGKAFDVFMETQIRTSWLSGDFSSLPTDIRIVLENLKNMGYELTVQTKVQIGGRSPVLDFLLIPKKSGSTGLQLDLLKAEYVDTKYLWDVGFTDAQKTITDNFSIGGPRLVDIIIPEEIQVVGAPYSILVNSTVRITKVSKLAATKAMILDFIPQ